MIVSRIPRIPAALLILALFFTMNSSCGRTRASGMNEICLGNFAETEEGECAFDVTLSGSKTDGCLIAASYTPEGRLRTLAAADADASTHFVLSGTNRGDKVKIFWMDCQGIPMSESAEGIFDIKAVQDDYTIIKERYKYLFWKEEPKYSLEEILEDLIVEDNNYYFKSVDYQSDRAASWPPQMHLQYTADMIREYGQQHLEENLETIIGLLDYWLDNDFICPTNWYPNYIGVPQRIANLAIILGGYLSESQYEKIEKILSRGTIGENERISKFTGANLADVAQITLMRGVINKNDDYINLSHERIESLITIQNWGNDGIQSDFEYYSHTNVLTTAGSYGTVYSNNISTFIFLLSGTKHCVAQEKESLFVDFVLDGEQFFHRNLGTANFSIARSAVYCRGGDVIYRNLELLTQVSDIHRKDELVQYMLSYDDYSKIQRKSKYFPLSGTIVSISPESFVAFRGSQKGNGLTDVINNQGVLNYNLSYGSNSSYMYYGDEYKSIGAVFDFSMYPGTTSYYEDDQQLYKRYEEQFNISWGRVKRPNIDCKGYSDNDSSISILKTDLYNDGISGNNLFIIKDNTAFSLGSGFNCEGKDNCPVITTVDQCLSGSLDEYTAVLGCGMQMMNREFVYTNLCDSELTCTVREQSGSYRRGDAAGDETVQTEKVFAAFYDWGAALSDMSYAYAVSPRSAAFDISDIERIENNRDRQIIEFSDGFIVGYSYFASEYVDKNGNTHQFDDNDLVFVYP